MSEEVKTEAQNLPLVKGKGRYLRTKWFSGIECLKRDKQSRLIIEAEINLFLKSLEEKGETIISISPHNYGISPIKLIYNVIIEKKDKDKKPSKKSLKMHRYIRVTAFSENIEKTAETEVNKIIDELTDNGANIIAITSHNFGVKPVNLLYNIIYEATKEL